MVFVIGCWANTYMDSSNSYGQAVYQGRARRYILMNADSDRYICLLTQLSASEAILYVDHFLKRAPALTRNPQC